MEHIFKEMADFYFFRQQVLSTKITLTVMVIQHELLQLQGIINSCHQTILPFSLKVSCDKCSVKNDHYTEWQNLSALHLGCLKPTLPKVSQFPKKIALGRLPLHLPRSTRYKHFIGLWYIHSCPFPCQFETFLWEKYKDMTCFKPASRGKMQRPILENDRH